MLTAKRQGTVKAGASQTSNGSPFDPFHSLDRILVAVATGITNRQEKLDE